MSLTRGKIDFVGHNKLKVDITKGNDQVPFHNVIHKARSDDELWAEEITTRLGDWRAVFRSSYMCWALSINGLFVARDRYSGEEWTENKRFQVRAIRPRGESFVEVPISEWPGKRAADAHASIIPMILAYSVVDMYGALEEFVFDLYKIYLERHPLILLRGDDNRPLLKFYKQYLKDASLEEEWKEKWNERLRKWQRKRAYDGLSEVFLAFLRHANLKEPSHYRNTTVETWAEVIKGIGVLRNCIAHGERVVPKELADFSKKPYSVAFDFEEAQDINVKLHHLQGIELFCDQLLTALNISILEAVHKKPLKQP
jgi:hypothetical protein